MRARTVRLVSLAALLPLLVVAAAGVGYDRLRCRNTGQVESAEMADAGCCPAEEGPATPVLRDARCCDRETAEANHPPAEPTAGHAPFEAPPAPSVLAVLPPAAPALPNLARAARATRPPPTPLLLVKQSFLI
jgi:hypothetical protein